MSFEPRQERESVPGAQIARIAGVSIAIGVAAAVVAWRIERATMQHPSMSSSVDAPAPLGTVDRTLLDGFGRGLEETRAQRRELARWSWADRDAGVARIPIDRAIDLWLAREGAGESPPAPPPPRPVVPMPPGQDMPGADRGMKAPAWRAH